jgi:hypothetical protein
MKRPNASVLIKKLASGEISSKEFDLFLKGLEDSSLKEDYERGFRELFDRFLKEGNPSTKIGGAPEGNESI